MLSFTTLLTAAALLLPSLTHATPNQVLVPVSQVVTLEDSRVFLRIEGSEDTIYEDHIISGPRYITTSSGGTHLCDGKNHNANPYPYNTCTAALDAASMKRKFAFDGSFSRSLDDFFITCIGHDKNTDLKFWHLVRNYQSACVGGCQLEVVDGDEVLWAYIGSNMTHFLKVTPNMLKVKKGERKTVQVVDGSNSTPVKGASIGGIETDAMGYATLVFEKTDKFKATLEGWLRSNALIVQVT